jgi:hypothetical protein
MSASIAPAPDATRHWQATLTAAAAQFDPISLQEMDAVALLNRIDLKYILTPAQLLTALESLPQHYRLLSVAGVRLNRYRTLYWDTADFALYRAHHNGSGARYKVRFRSYLDSNRTFFEIKRKTNQNRTIKHRLPVAGPQLALEPPALALLDQALPVAPPPLEPKLWNYFTRLTLVSTSTVERLTIDLDLQFEGAGLTSSAAQLVIAEVKQAGFAQRSPFVRQLQAMQIHPLGFSKYCIGAALHYPQLKSNAFKPIFLRMAKLGVTTLPTQSPCKTVPDPKA